MCVLLCVLLDQASPSNKEVSFQRRQGSDVSFQGHQVSDQGFQHGLKWAEGSLEPWSPKILAVEPGIQSLLLLGARTKNKCIFSRLGMHACLSASTDVSVFTIE